MYKKNHVNIQDLVVTIELRTESIISVLFLHLVPFFCVKGILTILTTVYKAVNQHWHTASYFRWFKWHRHMSTLSIANCLHGYVTLFLFSWFLRPKGSMVQKLSCHSMDWQAAGGSRSTEFCRISHAAVVDGLVAVLLIEWTVSERQN